MVLQKLAELVVAQTGQAPSFLIKHADSTRSALREMIAGVSTADQRHGGEGALYVALKRKG